LGANIFIQSTLKKVTALAKIREEQKLKFEIEIDGGISAENIKKIADAGCDIFVAGSSIFGQDNISAATTELKNLIS
jgi:ribulose-phosphate 3-epimerase